MKKLIQSALLCCCVLPMTVAAQEVPLIPMQDFFRNSERTGYSLSPDGKYFAFLAPWNNRMNIHVQEIGSDEVKRVTEASDRDIYQYFWANETQLAYLQDQGGNENFNLYLTNLDGDEVRNLTPFPEAQVGVIDDLKEIPEEMIISMNRRNPQVFDPYRLNLKTGELTQLAENPGNITGWMTDNDGRLRIALVSDGVNSAFLYRESEDKDFETIFTTDFRTTVSPLFFTFDNKHVYVSSDRDRDRQAIVRMDPANGHELDVLFTHPEVDVSNLLRSEHRKVITGVSYNVDKVSYHFFDERREALQKRFQEELPDLEVRIVGSSRDESRMMIRTFSDKTLGAYHLFDAEAEKITHITDVSPWLNPDQMADMKPISYHARDGLLLRGYLTLPRGLEPKNLPVVLLVHGGPWARDGWGFHPEVQFLANRGYAVLQVNFRGSTGFGRSFWEASFKEWGRSMQDDVTDGVKWLIEKGIADPEKVGIYGGSYGGYKALAGLTFTPDLYACGVSFVGPSNLFTLFASLPPYWEPLRQMMYAMVGDPEKEEELVRAASPLFHIDNIKAPLLIAQGANDPRVKQQESDQIVEALRAKGISVPYLLKENEGHGFSNEENRFHFYRVMEAFLAQHLGGRSEASADVLEELLK